MDFAGFDVSTKLGYAISGREPFVLKYVPKKDQHPMIRLSKYQESICNVVLERLTPKSLVCIESPSYNSKFRSDLVVVLNHLVRLEVYRRGCFYMDVTPLTLKKFVTGSGSGKKIKKEHMIEAVESRWGYVTTDDNKADAFGLMKLAESIGYVLDTGDYEPKLSNPRREAVAAVLAKYPQLDKLQAQ